MVDLEYLSLSKTGRLFYRFKKGFKNFFDNVGSFFVSIPKRIWNLLKSIGSFFPTVGRYFKYGDTATKLSFGIMGFGCLKHKQYLRGFLFLGYEICFIVYMIFFGGEYVGKLPTLGTVEPTKSESGFISGDYDNSFYILLFGIVTLFIIGITIFLWYQNVKQAYNNYEFEQINKKLVSGREDLRQLGNKYYHRTLLAFPMIGMFGFTVIPLIFMICVAFTNFDSAHYPPNKLFGWCGFDNFATLLSLTGSEGDYQAQLFGHTFKLVLGWTLLWAVIATFSCFFLGMVVAMIINKKGIKLKKFWRAALVTTMAVPQFISLLLMKNMLLSGAYDGIYNVILNKMGIDSVRWLSDPVFAKVTVIIVNLWVGIPYTVLSCTGILMNIPEDLYEAARIDGANPVKMYTNITLPYMMFVMAPSLITSFIGNLNNFNVIFLLTSGNSALNDTTIHPKAQKTSLLITWLYELTVNDQSKKYGLASVIGLFMFIICAVASLITFSRSKSFKNEEDFQ